MSDEQNDSPAFRLRPRRAEPKSYYTVRLEYSANPAAFTREKGTRLGSKRKASSQRGSSYSKTKQSKTVVRNKEQETIDYGQLMQVPLPQAPKPVVPTKEDIELEERRKRLQREIAESITTDTMISPFMQRLELSQLKPDSVYVQNYITLRIKSVEQLEGKHVVCKCCEIQSYTDSTTTNATSNNKNTNKLNLDVHLYDDYANLSLLTVGKILNIGKFRTSSNMTTKLEGNVQRVSVGDHNNDDTDTDTDNDGDADDNNTTDNHELRIASGREGGDQALNGGGGGGNSPLDLKPNIDRLGGFNVIVKFDESISRASSEAGPLIPFVSVTDMIEKPTDPYVEQPRYGAA